MNTKNTLLFALLFLISITTLTAQQLLNKTLVHDGETREYTVYIPANYQGDENVPLIFNFHGGGGDIAGQIYVSDMRPMADTAGFIVVYPQALPDPNDGGTALWTHKEPTEVDDVFFVAAMIDALADEYMIDENRVYACGYSNGGEFTFELACRLSHRIAAIGVVARSMFIDTYNECSPSHPMGVLTIHGTEDDYNGITWAGVTYYISLDDVNSYWSSFNNTDSNPLVTPLPNTNSGDGSTVEHYAWRNGEACVSVEHLKVINGGHDWPGTFGNMDIDASLEIWKFVSQYDKNGLIACSTTSVQKENNESQEIAILPNPTKGLVTIQMDLSHNLDYQIYSTIGELLLSGIIDANHKTIDVSYLPNNIYFLKVGNRIVRLVKL